MRVTVHTPDDLGPKLKQAANNEGLSISALTAKALENHLAQKRKKGGQQTPWPDSSRFGHNRGLGGIRER